MNKEETRELAETMLAWVDGKTIQVSLSNENKWSDFTGRWPDWHNPYWKWRIKPTLTTDNLPVGKRARIIRNLEDEYSPALEKYNGREVMKVHANGLKYVVLLDGKSAGYWIELKYEVELLDD